MISLITSIAIEFPFLVAWLLILYRIDRRWEEKGTGKIIFFMVVAGGVCVLPAWASYFVNPLWFTYSHGSFLFNFAVVGLAEELIKFLTFIFMARVMHSIREPADGIIQGAAIGIGFTLVENVLYGVWFWPGITLLRSFLIGFHGLAGAFWGFAWAGAVYENTGERRPQAYRQAFMAFIPVAALHSLYNTISDIAAEFDTILFILFGFEVILLLVAIRAFRWMQARSPYCRFPYSDASTAIVIIRKGLQRNPDSEVLRRRLAIYSIAAGRYHHAVSGLTRCQSGKEPDPALEAFLGVAMMGASQDGSGTEILASAAERMSERRRVSLEKELEGMSLDPVLALRVHRVLNPPMRAFDQWEARREDLRRWHAPRVVHKPATRYLRG